MTKKPLKSIKLTSHPGGHGPVPVPIVWGAPTAKERGPVIASLTTPEHRNVIGTHSGSYAVYRALAVAAGSLDPLYKPDLTNTAPTDVIGPFPQWKNPDTIVSIDPWGAVVAKEFAEFYEQGYDIRPTIAVTKAHIDMPEIRDAMAKGRLKIDGKILRAEGDVTVTKAAFEPVWHLPGIAKRFGCTEAELRRTLFEQTGGMFPELVTRGDLDAVAHQGVMLHVAHRHQAVDLLDAQPMQHIGHELLKAHVLHAGDALGAGKILIGAIAALLPLARVVDQELGDLAKRAAFLAKIDDEANAAGLRRRNALLDRVHQIWPARADIAAKDVRAVALVVHARG